MCYTTESLTEETRVVCYTTESLTEETRGMCYTTESLTRGVCYTTESLTDTLAAVDVFQEAGLAGQCGRAVFARMAPGFADGGAAQLLGADHTGQL